MSDLLTKLRADGGPLNALVDLLVDDLLARALGEVVDPERTTALVASSLKDFLASDRGQDRILSWWSDALDRIEQEERTLRDIVPVEVRAAADALAAQPYQPDPDALLALLDRGPVRDLLREILQTTLVDFGKKVASPVKSAPIAKGLGAFGNLGERARRRAGVLGALAEEVAGAVGGELERQVERKAHEFADTALSGVLQRIVHLLSDADRAQDQAALRKALLDGAWDWTGPVAAAELRRGDPKAIANIVREATSAWTSQDDFDTTIRGWIDELLAEQGHLTLGDFLDDLDLLDSFKSTTTELMQQRAHDFVATSTFAGWLEQLEEPT
jgi:hypothetical protein